jgi:hypothetical protein
MASAAVSLFRAGRPVYTRKAATDDVDARIKSAEIIGVTGDGDSVDDAGDEHD